MKVKGDGGIHADHSTLHGPFAVYDHAFRSLFPLLLKTTWKTDWQNMTSSNFMNQKIRSKNDRTPKGGGRNRKKSTPLLFLTMLVVFYHWAH